MTPNFTHDDYTNIISDLCECPTFIWMDIGNKLLPGNGKPKAVEWYWILGIVFLFMIRITVEFFF